MSSLGSIRLENFTSHIVTNLRWVETDQIRYLSCAVSSHQSPHLLKGKRVSTFARSDPTSIYPRAKNLSTNRLTICVIGRNGVLTLYRGKGISMETQVSRETPLFKNPTFWFYGSSSMAYGIKDNAFAYLLLIYANNCLGVPGYLSGLALAIAMIWDAITDPVLGHWSDKSNTRIGRRHPFMYVSLLLLPGGFYALFNPVVAVSGEDAFLYVLALAIIIRTGVTLFEVPCTALLPDLVKDYDERNRWLALRHFFGWTGGNGIHAINFFFWLGTYGVVAPTGYAIYGTAGAITIAIVIVAASLGTQRIAASLPQPTETFKFGEMFKEMRQIMESLKNRNFLALFSYGLALGAAGGLGAALYLYNVTYFFEFTTFEVGITAIAVLFSPPVASFFVPRLGRKLGKKKAAITCLSSRVILYPIPYIAVLNGFWPELGSIPSIAIYTAFIYTEVVLGIVGAALLDSMMADIVEDSERQTSRRSEGLFFATRAFAGKFMSASGILLAGIIVTAAGLDGIRSVEQVTMEVRFDIATFFLPLYCCLCFLGIGLVNLYKIDREAHNANLAALAEKGREKITES